MSSTPCSGVRHIQKIEPHVLSEILNFAFWMRKAGYRNSTVQTCVRALKALARRTNLLDPESVKSYLANAQLSKNRKMKLLEDVSRFYGHLKIPFNRPRYKRIETLPFIPLASEIDQLIAGAGQKSAAFLQCIKETAARPGEAWPIKWMDIDSERSCITIKPEKNSNPRQRKISPQLMTMLNGLPHRWPYVLHRPDADPRGVRVFLYDRHAKHPPCCPSLLCLRSNQLPRLLSLLQEIREGSKHTVARQGFFHGGR